jgi:hypothetical protein
MILGTQIKICSCDLSLTYAFKGQTYGTDIFINISINCICADGLAQSHFTSSASGAPQPDPYYHAGHVHVVPQEPIYNSEPPGAPLPRVVVGGVAHSQPTKSTTVQSIVTQAKSIVSCSILPNCSDIL